MVCLRGEVEERQCLFERRHLDRQLGYLGAGRAQGVVAIDQIRRRIAEHMRRHNDAAPAARSDHVPGKARGRFDVDILGALRDSRIEDASSFLFAPRKAATFPVGAARDDDGCAPALEGAGDVRAIDEVQPQLDQVGARRRVAVPTKVLHRWTCSSDAQEWFVHRLGRSQSARPKKEKPPQQGLRRLFRSSILRFGRLADGPLSARVPPPIGRLRPTEPARAAKESHREDRTITPFPLDLQAVAPYN